MWVPPCSRGLIPPTPPPSLFLCFQRTFGHPEVSIRRPRRGRVGRVWEGTEAWIPSAFSTLEMRSVRGAAKREVAGPHHGGRAPPLHPETPSRLAFIYFNLVDRHQTENRSAVGRGKFLNGSRGSLRRQPEAAGLLFPRPAPGKRAGFKSPRILNTPVPSGPEWLGSTHRKRSRHSLSSWLFPK